MVDIAIAIPDSSLSDEQTKRDKSIKISQFSRACSIFRVKKIYIYRDRTSLTDQSDRDLLKLILTYLDTPQYLRKKLFPKMKQLEYAGLLHPIKAPHHKDKRVNAGEIRVGILKKIGGKLYADIGLDSLSVYNGSGYQGKKINAKIVSLYPRIVTKEARKSEINDYWGYEIIDVQSLVKLLQQADKSTEIIITSKKGILFKDYELIFLNRIKDIRDLVLVFGSPKRDVFEILLSEEASIRYQSGINMFPFQGTETIRLEEAILGSLAIVNHFIYR
jgi:predicted SPOUT superfamily RNA methylase MTH1